MKKNIYVDVSEEFGVSCKNSTGTFGARCLHPFWQNEHRFIFPTKQAGFTSMALTPNYCYNNFDFENNYDMVFDSKNQFSGFRPPKFLNDSTRYVYCANDPLNHDARNKFCQSGGYLEWAGIAVGAMSDPDKICSIRPESGSRLCLFVPGNPDLTIEELYQKASGPGYTLEIYVLPISLKALRLIWMYPSTKDHSFYNFLDVPNQRYNHFNGGNATGKGFFKAQKLMYDASNQVM